MYTGNVCIAYSIVLLQPMYRSGLVMKLYLLTRLRWTWSIRL